MILALAAVDSTFFGASPSLLAAVFSASLLGSVHCMGMCGPFVAVVSGGGNRSSSSLSLAQKVAPQFSYHLGRAVTYIGLGALGGAAGAAVDFAGEAAGLVHMAALLSGLMVILWGVGLIFPRFSFASPLEGFLGRKLAQIGTKPRVFRASMLGVLTPLLPCGWLYAFVVTSAGTGSLAGGALVMTSFWLGTVPALVGMGALLSRLSEKLRARVPVFSGVALIAIGVFGVATKMAHPLASPQTGTSLSEPEKSLQEAAPCH